MPIEENVPVGLHITAYHITCPTCNGRWASMTFNEAQKHLHHCDACEQDVCIDCIIFFPHNMTSGMHKRMLYDRLSCRDACWVCIEKTELEYIQELPIEELPLIIAWQWISKTANQAVQERLAAVK